MMTLKTRWADEAMCDLPLPEYPRPQMVREDWVNLNGMFDFAITGDIDWCDEYNDEIRVPFAVESCLSGICKRVSKDDRLWYRKKITLPESFKGKRTLLHFGAVDWECKVYINKKEVGSHIGGYCPFTLDITDALTDGENELVVRVYDPTDEGWQNRGKQASESHGFWYTSTSGIWQTVWMEAVNENYIASYKVTPDVDTGVIALKTAVIGSGDLKIKIYDGEKVVAEKVISADDKIAIPDMKLWCAVSAHRLCGAASSTSLLRAWVSTPSAAQASSWPWYVVAVSCHCCRTVS